MQILLSKFSALSFIYMDLSTLQQIQENFLQELELASAHHKTSLPFILNTLPSSPLVKEGEVFQVLAIGGSIYRKALLKKTSSGITILEVSQGSLPKFATKEIFLSFIAEHIDTNVQILAINFAYEIKPVFEKGRLDGIFTRPSKEHTFTGLIGQKIAEEIENFVFRSRKQSIKVSVANDTVCLILSGLTQISWDHLAAGIVGTGLNFALFLDKNTVVNLESGSFAAFEQTATGKRVDQNSQDKGRALFEKEVSGAFLWQHFNLSLKQKNLDYRPVATTEEVSMLAVQNIPDVSTLATSLLERSASFVATQIAGITSFHKKNLTFVMQGGLFWQGYRYKETIMETVKKLIPSYHVNFIDVRDSDILGAAKLVA